MEAIGMRVFTRDATASLGFIPSLDDSQRQAVAELIRRTAIRMQDPPAD